MVREMELSSSRTNSSPLGCTFHGWIASCEARAPTQSGELCALAVRAVCRAPCPGCSSWPLEAVATCGLPQTHRQRCRYLPALPFLRAGRCLRVFPLEPIEPSVAPQITDFVLFPCLAET